MPTECVEWAHARDKDGYGVHGYPQKRAHRTAWEEVHGPIPDGLLVLHDCDNPPCINVEHLYLGTWRDNMQDRLKRGRNPQVNKTHCDEGHEFTPENTQYNNRGWRVCRACKKVSNRKQYLKRKVNANA